MIYRLIYQNQGKEVINIKIIVPTLIFSIFCIIGIVCADTPDTFGNSVDYGWFKVDSVPHIGEVFFDGQYYGSSPIMVMVCEDEFPSHEVIIRMDGYEDYTQRISYNPGSGEIIPISLDATHTLANIFQYLNKNEYRN
jgi:hypothetical protein